MIPLILSLCKFSCTVSVIYIYVYIYWNARTATIALYSWFIPNDNFNVSNNIVLIYFYMKIYLNVYTKENSMKQIFVTANLKQLNVFHHTPLWIAFLYDFYNVFYCFNSLVGAILPFNKVYPTAQWGLQELSFNCRPLYLIFCWYLF